MLLLRDSQKGHIIQLCRWKKESTFTILIQELSACFKYAQYFWPHWDYIYHQICFLILYAKFHHIITYRLLTGYSKVFLVFCICTRKTEDIIILWIMRSHRDFQYVWFLCVISASMMPLWFCHLIAQGKWRRCVRFFHYTHYRYLIPSSFSFKLTNKNTKDITVAS